MLLNDENDIKLSVWVIILLVLCWIVLEISISVKMDPWPNLSIRWEDIFELIWLWNAWLSIKKMNLELNGVKLQLVIMTWNNVGISFFWPNSYLCGDLILLILLSIENELNVLRCFSLNSKWVCWKIFQDAYVSVWLNLESNVKKWFCFLQWWFEYFEMA